ncbi:SDR family NAD(P)-dependent oxidoreductase [Pontibacter sp. KCTC 32443]|uniref:SDR family NAD(P)-dependent oxidoreductase n=1 Tax=Pontibacter TaxID=323449 RepID=UPI00164E1D2D|nr:MULTISPECIES: SDR family NAD(P)-dependent oxidoreductase [Pontibacter]MBC5772665.1 SDR family NAD(P)-dependent oxidoreductase [Pontibacter sp. KCTC 32443]
MTQISGSIVLITGGASGIGKLMGRKCLLRGASQLVIWDVNPSLLEQTIAEFAAEGYNVWGYLVDVANAQAVQQAAEQVIQDVGLPTILVNNAGIVVGDLFQQHSYLDIDRTLGINIAGPMYVAKAFLDGFVSRGSGHIVNIASAAGLTPNPRMSVYAASKWAVLGWSESLRLELEQQSKNLHVTTVTPSYINTGMFAGARGPLLTPILEPKAVSEAIVQAIAANRIIVRKPSVVYLLPLLRGLLPTRLFDLIVGRFFNVYTSMDHFTGRPAPAQSETDKKPNL